MRWLLSILMLAATPVAADVVPCTPQMVGGGLCRAAANRLLAYDLDTTAQQRLVDAYAGVYNYQASVPCETEQQVDERGVLVAAGVGQGCTLLQVGQVVSNPQSEAQFAVRLIRWRIIEPVLQHEARPTNPPEPVPPDLGP